MDTSVVGIKRSSTFCPSFRRTIDFIPLLLTTKDTKGHKLHPLIFPKINGSRSKDYSHFTTHISTKKSQEILHVCGHRGDSPLHPFSPPPISFARTRLGLIVSQPRHFYNIAKEKLRHNDEKTLPKTMTIRRHPRDNNLEKKNIEIFKLNDFKATSREII